MTQTVALYNNKHKDNDSSYFKFFNYTNFEHYYDINCFHLYR